MSIIRKFGIIQKPNKKIFSFLYEEYYYKSYAVALRITRDKEAAEDIAHEAFERAFENFDGIESMDHFVRWIIVTSTNLAIDELKKNRQYILKDEVPENGRDYLHRDFSPEHMYLREEYREEVLNVINSLKPMYSVVLYLRFYCDMSYREMAEKLNINENTLRSRCSRALKLLKEKLRHSSTIRRVK